LSGNLAEPVDGPRVLRLDQLLARRAALTPEATAFEFEEARLSYGELDQLANGLAHDLVADGAGAVVPIVLERSLALPVALFGVLKAGAAVLYLDPSDPAERTENLLKRVRPAVVLTSAAVNTTLPETAVRIHLEQPPAARRWTPEPPVSSASEESIAQLLQTSGSTGEPKLVMRSHRMLAGQLVYEQETFRFTAADRHLFKFPASFRESLLPALAGGVAVIAAPGGHRDSGYLASLIRDRRVTVASFVPSALKDLLAQPEITACVALRRVSCGGELMSGEIARRFHAKLRARLQTTYTMTEADFVSTWECRPDETRPDGWLGRETNMRLLLLDEALEPVAEGEIGEIVVGGPALAEGYFEDSATTAERFIADPRGPPGVRLYRSGDLGRRLADGSVVYAGRADDQVKIGGQRIDLGEVDTALLALPGVVDAATAAWTPPGGDCRLVAHIVEAVQGVAGPHLRARLARTLPGHMLPSHFVPASALPRLASGKLDRRSLPPPERRRNTTGSAFAAPTGATATSVARIWEDVLWIDDVGLDDRFFDLGGTSLLAMQIRSRINAELGVGLSMADLLIHSSIREMAAWIDRGEPASSSVGLEAARAARRRQGLALRSVRREP
jgi:amino acid adenylation domain-containing protein